MTLIKSLTIAFIFILNSANGEKNGFLDAANFRNQPGAKIAHEVNYRPGVYQNPIDRDPLNLPHKMVQNDYAYDYNRINNENGNLNRLQQKYPGYQDRYQDKNPYDYIKKQNHDNKLYGLDLIISTKQPLDKYDKKYDDLPNRDAYNYKYAAGVDDKKPMHDPGFNYKNPNVYDYNEQHKALERERHMKEEKQRARADEERKRAEQERKRIEFNKPYPDYNRDNHKYQIQVNNFVDDRIQNRHDLAILSNPISHNRFMIRSEFHDKCYQSYEEFNTNNHLESNPGAEKSISALLRFKKFINKGSFGQVYEIPWYKDQTKIAIAVKVMNIPYDQEEINNLKSELKYMFDPTLKTINPAFACLQLDGKISVFQPRLPFDLNEKETKNYMRRASLNEKVALFIKIGIALEGLHQNRIVHSDLKPANMMSTDSKFTRVKIIDMGKSGLVGSTYEPGSPYFSSPDKVNSAPKKHFGHDLWSYALIIIDLIQDIKYVYPIAEHHCLDSRFTDDCINKVKNRVETVLKRNYNQKFVNAVKSMLIVSKNPQMPSVTQILTQMREAYPEAAKLVRDTEDENLNAPKFTKDNLEVNQREFLDFKRSYKQIVNEENQKYGYLKQNLKPDVFAAIKDVSKRHNLNENQKQQEIDKILAEKNLDGYKRGYYDKETFERMKILVEEEQKRKAQLKDINQQEKVDLRTNQERERILRDIEKKEKENEMLKQAEKRNVGLERIPSAKQTVGIINKYDAKVDNNVKEFQMKQEKRNQPIGNPFLDTRYPQNNRNKNVYDYKALYRPQMVQNNNLDYLKRHDSLRRDNYQVNLRLENIQPRHEAAYMEKRGDQIIPQSPLILRKNLSDSYMRKYQAHERQNLQLNNYEAPSKNTAEQDYINRLKEKLERNAKNHVHERKQERIEGPLGRAYLRI